MKHDGKICSWHGPAGALVTMEPVPGVTSEHPLGDSAKFYQGDYMIAESMSEGAARAISDALGLHYMGKTTGYNVGGNATDTARAG